MERMRMYQYPNFEGCPSKLLLPDGIDTPTLFDDTLPEYLIFIMTVPAFLPFPVSSTSTIDYVPDLMKGVRSSFPSPTFASLMAFLSQTSMFISLAVPGKWN